MKFSREFQHFVTCESDAGGIISSKSVEANLLYEILITLQRMEKTSQPVVFDTRSPYDAGDTGLMDRMVIKKIKGRIS